MDCRMDGSFTIPEELTTDYYIDLQIDYNNTMNFWEDDSLPGYAPFQYNTLDLGPGYVDSTVYKLYGDYGLHPFLPVFEVESNEE